MNCSEARELLSAYYDGELLFEVRERVAAHIEGCPDCIAELGSFQKLTALAQGLTLPHPPAQLWAQLADQLDAQSTVELAQKPRAWVRVVAGLVSVAAILVFALGIGIIGFRAWRAADRYKQDAFNVAAYLDAFQRHPQEAQRLLVAKYNGRLVDLEQAGGQLGYRPMVADGLPKRYAVNSAYLLKMPGCNCVQCLCQRDDGETLAVFEHDEQHPVSFGDRPAIATRCNGKSCSIVQLGDRLAVTWKANRRHITVIGARDLKEIKELMDWMEQNRPL